MAALAVVALTAAVVFVPLPAFVELPSTPQLLEPCVSAARSAGEVSGDYLLMTVGLIQATTADTVVAWARRDRAVVDRSAVIPPGVDDDTYFDDQAKLFATTSDVAAVVGVRAAGFPATLRGHGAAVVDVVPGSPADGALQRGDVITAVDGTRVSDLETLRRTIAGTDGAAVDLAVRRGGRTIHVQLTPTLIQGQPAVGIEPQLFDPEAQLPFEVTVDARDVGGPSAGLSIALAVYDTIAAEDLLAGRRLAVTGTIDVDGNVGPVGGIALKGVAAQRAGADLFVVPQAQVAEAGSALDRDVLAVVGVRTFDDAREALRRASPATRRARPHLESACGR